MLSDAEFLRVYDLPAPYSMVRFSRLRMSIRMVLRSPFELLALLFVGRHDARSWLKALQSDLEWMAECVKETKFDLISWCAFARESPKAARTLVRKVCHSELARSVSVCEQTKAIARLDMSYNCWCGTSFNSKAALDRHKGTVHDAVTPVQWYAAGNTCFACMTSFSNREGLIFHLSRGHGTCMLNTILRLPPISREDLDAYRKHERIATLARERAGVTQHKVDRPPIRVAGPLWLMIDLQGNRVDTSSNAHPFGPQKRKYIPGDAAKSCAFLGKPYTEESFTREDDIIFVHKNSAQVGNEFEQQSLG
jgi:hypothetical protein